jgi:hypothetical protein
MKSQSHTGATVYHSSLISIFVLVFPESFVVFMVWVGLDEGLRYTLRHDTLAFAISLAYVPTGWVVSWIVCRYDTYILSKEGIQGRSFWGLRRFIPWQDIREARGFRFLHLRWVRLYSARDQKVTWIALFQAHPEEFAREIQTLAPSDSPILRLLRKGSSPKRRIGSDEKEERAGRP